MKISFALALGMLTLATAAGAQAPAASTTTTPTTDRGYVEAVGHASFADVQSKNFGAEVGVTVWRNVQVFAEFGKIQDTATKQLLADTATIAAALSTVQTGAVTYQVKQPMTFGGGGVKYVIPLANTAFKPYVLGGAGMAKVSKDVTFGIGGSTSALAQYVTLGSDLTGEETKAMFTFGGGVAWSPWRQLVFDLQYRFGHVATEQAISVSRVGLGIGVRF